MYKPHEHRKNVIADEHLPTEGEQSPSKEMKSIYLPESRLMYDGNKLYLICSECRGEIGVYQANRGRLKQYCEKCIKKHIKERNKKRCKRLVKEGYWASEEMKKYRRERSWRIAEEQGIRIEHRAEIKNCVICGQDISMYPSVCKLCVHCREKNLNDLGTTNASMHMRKIYDHNKKEVVPDYDGELKFINTQKQKIGFK